jgi:hypothetical protein
MVPDLVEVRHLHDEAREIAGLPIGESRRSKRSPTGVNTTTLE